MKIVVSLILLTASMAFGQKADVAVATYAENGKLISVSNLSALSDCAARSAEGKVKSVKVEGDLIRAHLQSKKGDTDVKIPLDRLTKDDRDFVFRDLVKKKIILRVAGYACEGDKAIVAFSVDRLY